MKKQQFSWSSVSVPEQTALFSYLEGIQCDQMCTHFWSQNLKIIYWQKKQWKIFSKIPSKFCSCKHFCSHLGQFFTHFSFKGSGHSEGIPFPLFSTQNGPWRHVSSVPPCVLTRSFGRFDTHSSYWLYLNVWYLFLPTDHLI